MIAKVLWFLLPYIIAYFVILLVAWLYENSNLHIKKEPPIKATANKNVKIIIPNNVTNVNKKFRKIG